MRLQKDTQGYSQKLTSLQAVDKFALDVPCPDASTLTARSTVGLQKQAMSFEDSAPLSGSIGDHNLHQVEGLHSYGSDHHTPLCLQNLGLLAWKCLSLKSLEHLAQNRPMWRSLVSKGAKSQTFCILSHPLENVSSAMPDQPVPRQQQQTTCALHVDSGRYFRTQIGLYGHLPTHRN